jgi:hypothetical protein
VRRRACAAALLCGPLVAGCGTAARLDFKGHSRPATPADVSVYIGGGRALVDPRRLQPGPAIFNVTNQTSRSQTVSITAGDGRAVARGVAIPAGGTGQLKADLTLSAYGVELDGRPSSMTLVAVRGARRNGDDDLLQP